MNGNFFISLLLRSPLHGLLSGGMMLITVTGKKSGRRFSLPVGYFEQDGFLWTLSSRDRTWWRNLRGGAEVMLRFKGKDLRAFSEVELDESAVAARMADFVRHVPQAARSLGIRVLDGIPDAEDLARVSRERLFVRTKIAQP